MFSEYNLSAESHLVTTLNSTILPFWESEVITDHFTTPDNLSIHYAYSIPQHAKNTVVLCTGRTESYLKYQELMFDLTRLGFAVFILDHRGQGRSSRLLNNPHIGHIKEFEHYIDDFKQFLTEVVEPKSSGNGESFLIAHSMGCAISTLFMLAHPQYFKKAALLSPMFGISSGFVPPPVARSIVDVFRDTLFWEANKEKYFPGQVDYHDKPFIDNPLTTSETRFRIMQEINHQYPQTQLGGISFHWLHNAIEAIDIITNTTACIQTPLILFSAEQDRVVDNTSHSAFAKKHSCKHIVIEGAEHELLFEKDERRNEVLDALLIFFEQ